MKIYINPDQKSLKTILKRPLFEQENLGNLIEKVFEQVSLKGDEAVKQYTLQFDKVSLEKLQASEEEWVEIDEQIDTGLKKSIQQAYENIYLFHSKQIEEIEKIETMPGVVCWRKSVPIECVGLYIPGGTAPLFSTVLMLGIPAKIAGCKEIILCSPCNSDSKIHPAILYAAKLIGITKVFKIGGIQAIAAMTLGTETIPAVYKLFGPGNQYVTAAKLFAQKFNISIDMPAGPSEVMVICDESAKAKYIAADLLAQAEHGSDSQVILITSSEEKAREVEKEVQTQLEFLPRKKQAQDAINNSSIIVCEKDEISDLVNQYAPEHLILNTGFNAFLLENVSNAGSVFIGEFTPESAGDYASGTNHTLPTNGFARQYSGVSLDSFLKKITYQEISKSGLQNIGKTIEIMAEAEGLFAHKNAVTLRLNDIK